MHLARLHRSLGKHFLAAALVGLHLVAASLPAGRQWPARFPLPACRHAMPRPACIAPASYARTPLCIRWASQSADICGQAALTPDEASALTLHSMKSTALASAAQLDLRRDERLAQGHQPPFTLATTHSPASAYSVQLQPPWPQAGGHRGPWPGEARRPFPSLQCLFPRHCLKSTFQQDIVSGPWSPFASRREHLQASHGPEQTPCEDQAPNSPPASPDSPVLLQPQASSHDEEAGQVEEWAQLEQLFVCSSMRSPTPEGLAAYNTSAPEQGKPAVRLLQGCVRRKAWRRQLCNFMYRPIGALQAPRLPSSKGTYSAIGVIPKKKQGCRLSTCTLPSFQLTLPPQLRSATRTRAPLGCPRLAVSASLTFTWCAAAFFSQAV